MISNIVKYDQENREHKFISINRNYCGAFTCVLSGKRHRNEMTGCHSALRNAPKVTGFIGALADHPYREEWFDYLRTSKAYSPIFTEGWYKLMAGSDLIGFGLSDNSFKIKPYNLLYNFLIESRVPSEERQRLTEWYRLVSLGVGSSLAHIMSPWASTVSPGLFNAEPYAIGWGGGHSAFNDYNGQDFKNFLDGTPDVESSAILPSSSIWGKTKGGKSLYSKVNWSEFCNKETVIGKYSITSYWRLPDDRTIDFSKHIEGLIRDG